MSCSATDMLLTICHSWRQRQKHRQTRLSGRLRIAAKSFAASHGLGSRPVPFKIRVAPAPTRNWNSRAFGCQHMSSQAHRFTVVTCCDRRAGPYCARRYLVPTIHKLQRTSPQQTWQECTPKHPVTAERHLEPTTIATAGSLLTITVSISERQGCHNAPRIGHTICGPPCTRRDCKAPLEGP